MARLFDDAQSEYLQVAQAVISAAPLAMVCWFNTDLLLTNEVIFWIGETSSGNNSFILMTGTSNDLQFVSRTTSSKIATATLDFSVNTWHHACGIEASSTDRRVFLDGANKGTNTTASTPSGLDRTSIGIRAISAPDFPFSGMVGEATIYDLSVWPGATASDKADNFEKIVPSLAKGFSPDFYPLGRKSCWDLVRGLNDKIGGYNLTANGTTVSNHPRIILPHGAM